MLELSVKALSGVPSSHSSHSTNAPPRLPEQLLDDCKKKEDYGQVFRTYMQLVALVTRTLQEGQSKEHWPFELTHNSNTAEEE